MGLKRKMKKKEYIRKYGIAAYEKKLRQGRDRYAKHPEELRERNRLWRENNQEMVKAGKANWAKSHPEEVKAKSQQQCHIGGKYYEKTRQYKTTGIQHEKEFATLQQNGHNIIRNINYAICKQCSGEVQGWLS